MKTGAILADFEWQRAQDGYRWQRVGGRWLMVPASNDAPFKSVTYKPFAKATSGMFMEFAELADTPKAHLAFANKYGPLGFPVRMWIRSHTNFEQLPPQETVNAWLPEDFSSVGPVGEFFKLRGTKFDQASWSAQSALLHWFLHPPPSNPELEGDDGPHMMQVLMNRALESSVRVFFTWSEASAAFDLRMKPVSLLGAMWLQAALSMERGRAFRQCRVCKRGIAISRSGGARPDAVYCSNACRTKNFRERRKQARHLHAEGMALKKIATALDIDPATLRGWLA